MVVSSKAQQQAFMVFADPACVARNVGNRRLFWTTVESCGSYTMCGEECAIPGLQYVDSEQGRTIVNDDWLRSITLNILNTRARTDEKCPSPAAVYGHWSESYRDDGLHIGTRVFNAASKPYVKVTDAVKAIGAAVRSDLSKLVILKLADDVDVDVVYRGRNRVDIVVTTTISNVRHVLNLSGTHALDTWVWH